MTVKKLKEIMADLPDDMPVQLLDSTTDDDHACNYHIDDEDVFVVEGVKDLDDPESEKLEFLAIQFENKLNENPV